MAVNINHATDTITASSGTLSLPNFSGGGGLTHFAESESIASPNATVPVDALTATDAIYANIDVAVVAKGTGATLAQVPDATATGGDKRGTKATDWQKTRNNASEVASGISATISGGENNTASGVRAAIGGGESNVASGLRGVIGGGTLNTASGQDSTISGGRSNTVSAQESTVSGGRSNTASSQYSFVGGGQSNFASTNTHTTVCGGSSNTATGQYSFVGGGQSNAASGLGSVVVSGGFASASGLYSVCLGGYDQGANSAYSALIGGRRGTTRSIIGNVVFPASNIPISGSTGVTQSALLLLGRETTDATATVLASDTIAASATNQVTLPNTSAYSFSGEVIAGVTGAGDSARWTINGAIKRGANAASTAMIGTPTVTMTHNDAGAATWVVAVTANTTLGCITVTVTGAAATTIRWVCKINTTEMTY